MVLYSVLNVAFFDTHAILLFFKIFFGFINNTKKTNDSYNLLKYSIFPSTNLINLQLSLAMANGVTFALCQDKTMQLTNDVVNDLFHTKLFIDD